MKNKERVIGALLPTGETTDCIVRYTVTSPWEINLDCGIHGSVQSEGEDLFEAFIKIRKQLCEKGIFLLCNGSRCNIYPSPMLRQSNGGRKAYLLRLGVPARQEDIINIFDPVKKTDIDTIENQNNYYKQWLNSLNPTSKEVEEASKHPSGWVYRIDGEFLDNEAIPPTAIIGAWEVDSNGKLTNNFNKNKNYAPKE